MKYSIDYLKERGFEKVKIEVIDNCVVYVTKD